eukprot:6440311-Pyramimonas_sp.AAC.1
MHSVTIHPQPRASDPQEAQSGWPGTSPRAPKRSGRHEPGSFSEWGSQPRSWSPTYAPPGCANGRAGTCSWGP